MSWITEVNQHSQVNLIHQFANSYVSEAVKRLSASELTKLREKLRNGELGTWEQDPHQLFQYEEYRLLIYNTLEMWAKRGIPLFGIYPTDMEYQGPLKELRTHYQEYARTNPGCADGEFWALVAEKNPALFLACESTILTVATVLELQQTTRLISNALEGKAIPGLGTTQFYRFTDPLYGQRFKELFRLARSRAKNMQSMENFEKDGHATWRLAEQQAVGDPECQENSVLVYKSGELSEGVNIPPKVQKVNLTIRDWIRFWIASLTPRFLDSYTASFHKITDFPIDVEVSGLHEFSFDPQLATRGQLEWMASAIPALTEGATRLKHSGKDPLVDLIGRPVHRDPWTDLLAPPQKPKPTQRLDTIGLPIIDEEAEMEEPDETTEKDLERETSQDFDDEEDKDEERMSQAPTDDDNASVEALPDDDEDQERLGYEEQARVKKTPQRHLQKPTEKVKPDQGKVPSNDQGTAVEPTLSGEKVTQSAH